MSEPDAPDAAAPSRPLIVVAAVLCIGLVAVVVAIGLIGGGNSNNTDNTGTDTAANGPLALPGAPAPKADSSACTMLLDALPDMLESAGKQLSRRELAEPAPEGAAAWGAANPVVLRCGISKPGALTKTSKLRQVNDVQWLPVRDKASTTWYAVDRKAYIALTLPNDAGTGPLQELSDVIDAELTAVQPQP